MNRAGRLIRRNPVTATAVLAIVVAAVAVAVIVPLSSQSSAESVPTSSSCPARAVVGIAGGAEIMTLPDAELDRELDMMLAMGASWIRVGVEWNAVESSPGDFDWSVPDRIVERARSRGMEVLGVVLGTPRWARPPGVPDSPHALPADPDRFGQFAGDVAAHYDGQIDTWEIWNEPNIVSFAKPRPAVDRYHDMLIAAARDIRARTSPDKKIMTAGLAPAGDDGWNIAPTTFLTRLYELGDQQDWDIVGMHPYTYPYQPDDDDTADWNAYLRMQLVRDTMQRYGDDQKQIWITEFGAPTGGDPKRAVSLENQARTLVTVLTDAGTDPLLGPVFIHSTRDRGSDPNDIEDHFGVLKEDFSPKPAYTAVQEIAAC